MLALDTGFIVHNARTYPTLIRLFDELGVRSQPTEMSMSVRCLGCGLEYAGSRGPRALVPRAGQLARPGYLHLLATVPRFYRAARRLLGAAAGSPEPDELTLGEFLAAGRYSRYFIGHFVVPIISAIWSCSSEDALAYPARYLFEFLDHHGMLSLTRASAWRTLTGGSVTYVERIAKQLSTVRTGTAVTAIRRSESGGVEITDADGEAVTFAVAVVAAHPDDALALLAAPTEAEREVLGAFSYSTNEVALHADGSVLPVSRAVRASWNYQLDHCGAQPGAVHVSYDLGLLHRLSEPDDYIVTLNALDRVDPGLVIDKMTYRHPRYTRESVAAQRRLPELNRDGLAFAGAYHGWGFHEDGCRSGVAAAGALGVRW